MTATNPLPAIIELPADALLMTFPPKSERTLNRLRGVLGDRRKANKPTASDDFTARWNERVDTALALPIARLDEADAMMRLALAVQGETPDDLFRTALESVAAVLAAGVAAGKQ